MGLDLIWCEVDWDELSRCCRSSSGADDLDQALEDEDCPWLQRVDMDDEWLSLFQSWYGLLEFNDGLIDYERDVYDALLREFPVLKDCGVIWDAETLCHDVPYELEDGNGIGELQGALSPTTAGIVAQNLQQLDRAKIRRIIASSESFDEGEIFNSPSEFIDFIDAITRAFSAAAAKGKGMLMYCAG